MSLTTIQNQILQYIKQNVADHGVAPSTSEICGAFGFKSFGTVARHMKRLEEKGYLRRAGRRNKQGVCLRERPVASKVPLLGSLSQARPFVPTPAHHEWVAVPEFLLGEGEHFAVSVEGSGFASEGMGNGDLLILRGGVRPRDGQTVLAGWDDQSFVRRHFRFDQKIELRSNLSTVKPVILSALQAKRLVVYGTIVGLLRQYA